MKDKLSFEPLLSWVKQIKSLNTREKIPDDTNNWTVNTVAVWLMLKLKLTCRNW